MHWVVSLFIIGQLSVGLWMSNLPDTYPDKFYYYNMHKSFGLILLALICLRLVARIVSVIPSYKRLRIKGYEIKLAKVTHLLLYIFMFVLPLSGYTMSNLGGHPINFFGIQVINLLPTKMHGAAAGMFHSIHVYGGITLITLIVLHILGSMKHYFVDKTNLLKRM